MVPATGLRMMLLRMTMQDALEEQQQLTPMAEHPKEAVTLKATTMSTR
jgi:hypothetical protein